MPRHVVSGYRRGSFIHVPKPEKREETLGVFQNGTTASAEVLKALRSLGYKVDEVRGADEEPLEDGSTPKSQTAAVGGGDGADKKSVK